MKQEHISEIKAVIILAIGLILLASLVSFVPDDLTWYTSHPNIPAKNLIRITGAYAAGSLFFVFGYSAYVLVLFLFFWSWNKFTLRNIRFTPSKLVSFAVLFCVLSTLLGITGSPEASALAPAAHVVFRPEDENGRSGEAAVVPEVPGRDQGMDHGALRAERFACANDEAERNHARRAALASRLR